MKPPPFDYHRPEAITEVLALLDKYGEACRLLAGGQSLVPLLNLRMARPSVLIDLNRCAELSYIERRGSFVACGAMTRQIAAQYSPEFIEHCRLVTQCLDYGGPVAIRNRGTVGGVLAHADRSAELPAVAVALDATMVIESAHGCREVPAQEFFLGDLATAIDPNEMLREVRFPIQSLGCFSVFVESGNRQRDLALAGVACQLAFGAEGRCHDARLVVVGVEGAPTRLSSVETHIIAGHLDAKSIADAGRIAMDSINPDGDVHASAEYRQHLVGILVTKAISQVKANFESVGMSP